MRHIRTALNDMNETVARLKRLAAQVDIPPPEAPICAECDGKGVISYAVPVGDPRFGKAFPCPAHDCPVRRANALRRFQRIKQLYSVDMDAAYRDYTFASWKKDVPSHKQAGKMLAYLAARYFSKSADQGIPFTLSMLLMHSKVPFSAGKENGEERLVASLRGREETFQDSHGSWLVFQGDYGTGKTGLGIAALNALQKRDVFAIYIHLPTYLDLFQATYRFRDDEERHQEQMKLTGPLVEAAVLMVDEMNVAEASSGAASEDKTRIVLNHIIQPRWVAGHSKPTLITTNKSAAEFERHWGTRISSRIFERAHWLRLTGLALRQRNLPVEG